MRKFPIFFVILDFVTFAFWKAGSTVKASIVSLYSKNIFTKAIFLVPKILVSAVSSVAMYAFFGCIAITIVLLILFFISKIRHKKKLRGEVKAAVAEANAGTPAVSGSSTGDGVGRGTGRADVF